MSDKFSPRLQRLYEDYLADGTIKSNPDMRRWFDNLLARGVVRPVPTKAEQARTTAEQLSRLSGSFVPSVATPVVVAPTRRQRTSPNERVAPNTRATDPPRPVPGRLRPPDAYPQMRQGHAPDYFTMLQTEVDRAMANKRGPLDQAGGVIAAPVTAIYKTFLSPDARTNVEDFRYNAESAVINNLPVVSAFVNKTGTPPVRRGETSRDEPLGRGSRLTPAQDKPPDKGEGFTPAQAAGIAFGKRLAVTPMSIVGGAIGSGGGSAVGNLLTEIAKVSNASRFLNPILQVGGGFLGYGGAEEGGEFLSNIGLTKEQIAARNAPAELAYKEQPWAALGGDLAAQLLYFKLDPKSPVTEVKFASSLLKNGVRGTIRRMGEQAFREGVSALILGNGCILRSLLRIRFCWATMAGERIHPQEP